MYGWGEEGGPQFGRKRSGCCSFWVAAILWPDGRARARGGVIATGRDRKEQRQSRESAASTCSLLWGKHLETWWFLSPANPENDFCDRPRFISHEEQPKQTHTKGTHILVLLQQNKDTASLTAPKSTCIHSVAVASRRLHQMFVVSKNPTSYLKYFHYFLFFKFCTLQTTKKLVLI